MKRFRVVFQPGNRETYIPGGVTLKEAMDMAGIPFDFPCGGRGKCGKCRVKIAEGAAPPATAEKEHLDAWEIEEGVRLACLAVVERDLVVELPYEKTPEHKILMESVERSVKLDPHLLKAYVEVEPPSLEDQRSDWRRLRDALAEKDERYRDSGVSLGVLRDLPQALRAAKYKVTAVAGDGQIIGVEAGDTTDKMLGIAFDIGTTTIVGYLLDLRTGEELSVVSALNPQTRFGADVISRITFATQEDGGLTKLQSAVVEMLNSLVGEAAEKAGVRREDVYAMTVVGNTCMHHLFLGINPKHLALSPYVPVVSEPLALAADELQIRINPAGRIFVLPNIAGFVGADTVAVLLATELDWSDGIKLAIDIGTNGEIVLGSRERLVACSAAAGPAFEGAQISSGMRGAQGAIDHVRFGDDVEYTVIGGGKPKGICGSGLLDAVAGLIKLGIIDRRGRISEPEQLAGTSAERFKGRLIKYEGMSAFLLADESETEHGRAIMITQRDVRELQLAKGAIATGIQVLMEKLGIGVTDIKEVLLAGAFGNYMDPHSACAIGLIPPELEERVKPIGNAAGTGAKLALLSRGEFQRAAAIARFVEYVELGSYPSFPTIFANSMSFPERR
ncbi:MAG: ASKHA domain-containing protein [Thermacetogeniaceae bacterium]